MVSDSDFICNCAAIRLSGTEEGRREYEEHYTQQVKKELIVEKVKKRALSSVKVIL